MERRKKRKTWVNHTPLECPKGLRNQEKVVFFGICRENLDLQLKRIFQEAFIVRKE